MNRGAWQATIHEGPKRVRHDLASKHQQLASSKARSLSRGSSQEIYSMTLSSDACVSSALFLALPLKALSGSTLMSYLHNNTCGQKFPKNFSQSCCFGHMPISNGAWGFGIL